MDGFNWTIFKDQIVQVNNLILFGLLIVLLVAAQFSSAKTVEEIIEKHVRARGGKNKLGAIESIYMEGVKEMMGKEVTVKISKQQGKLSRTAVDTGVAYGFVLITDTMGWTYFSLRTPAALEMPEEELADLQYELDIVGPLSEYVSKGHTAELIGKDTVDGNRCYKIKLTLAGGNEMMFWIDTGTYLLLQSKLTFTKSSSGKKDSYKLYRDYKEVSGIQFAHSLQTKTPGAQQDSPDVEIVFHKILVNPRIDPVLFLPEQL
ncbi:MAG: hypothetical protein JWP81_1765 [Ferruginibacter sp.]|nr:hypothetical protein [Ferruginibacter sp.]